MKLSTLFRSTLFAFCVSAFSLASLGAYAGKDGNQAAHSMVKVSINSANAMMLSEALSGIGLKKAEAIVAYRKANGKFTRLEDLTLVKGIGLATLEKNKAKLTL